MKQHYPHRAAIHPLNSTDILPITVITPGASLHIDRDNEAYWIEVTPGCCDLARMAMESLAEAQGLEMIPEDECPAEITPEGNYRIYLVEVFS